MGVYDSHEKAENAVKELQKAGFDMKKLSILGRDYHTEEHVVGYYNTGDRMKAWGKIGAFWGSIWGLLFGAAFFCRARYRSHCCCWTPGERHCRCPGRSSRGRRGKCNRRSGWPA